MLFAWIAEKYGCVESIKNRLNANGANGKYKIKIYRYSIWIFCSFLPLFLLSGFRSEVGTDTTGTYTEIFQLVQDGKSISIRDKGYLLINKIVLFFTSDFTLLLIVTSFLIAFFMFKAIYEQSVSPVFSILLYFITSVFFMSMNIIRQSIATVIFLFALKYVSKREFWKYFFWIIIATSIHTMAFIYIFIYFLYNIKLTRKKVVVSLAFIVLSRYMIEFLIHYIVANVKILAYHFGSYYYSVYNTGKIDFWSLLVELTVLGFLFFIYKRANEDKQFNLFFLLEFISVALLLLSDVIPLSKRICWMFNFSKIIFLPKMIQYVSNKKTRLVVYIGIICGFAVYTYITAALQGYNEVVPYQSIFTNK